MYAFVFLFMAIAAISVNWSYVQPSDLEFEEPIPSITGLEQPKVKPVTHLPTPTAAVVRSEMSD